MGTRSVLLPQNQNKKGEDASALRIQQQFINESALMKHTLDSIGTRVNRFCTFYYVDTSQVSEFDNYYELYASEPFALLFFYRNKHIKIDLGTGNNNKINFPTDTDEMINILEVAFLGAKAGKTVIETRMEFSQYAGRGQEE